MTRPIIVPIGPSIAYVELTQGQYSLIDSEDAERVGIHNWFAHRRHGEFYAATNIYRPGGGQITVSLHNFITSFKMVDHRNRVTLDNRKTNLREATIAENNRNHKNLPRKHPYKGIRPNGKKWVSVIFFGKPIYLGTFITAEDAAIAYDKAAVEYHGEFASLNFGGV